jgi:glycine amidinotransferase
MKIDNCIVNSYNEWDLLEEVIVGSAIGAAHVAYEPALNAYPESKYFLGNKQKEKDVEMAEIQLNNLAKILEERGIIVRRPDKTDYFQPYKTPHFEVPCGNANACPRDVLLVVGNQIIEAPMGFRGRFFEYLAYRSLVKEYFRKGAKWVSAPKPSMSDELYVKGFSVESEPFDADTHPSLTDFEPCFDAASFTRVGKDIFYQPDIVTNDFGAQWLSRHLGSDYRMHRVKFADKRPPQHIDATFVPLKPGLLFVNPERPCIDDTLDLFKKNRWEVVEVVPSVNKVGCYSPEVSEWISMNVFCIDENTIIVEEREEPMIKQLEKFGFEVIACPFSNVYKFGGSFHCCTLDIRRRGTLQSYFPSLDK